MPVSTSARQPRTSRLLPLATAALLAVACDRSDPLAPEAGARGATVAPSPAWLAPSANTVWSGNFVFDELALVGNVFQGTASASAINESGILAGSTQGYFDGLFVSVMRATRWTPSGPQLLGVLPPYNSGKHSWAIDVNDAGAIIGSSYAGTIAGGCCSPIRGFIWTEANGMQPLPSLAGVPDNETRANAINNVGAIVGSAIAADGSWRAVMWPDATQAPVDISLPGDNWTTAHDINDAGVVVGAVSNSTGGAAFRWSEGGGVQLLPGLGGAYAEARAINTSGAIVGVAAVADGTEHAFLWTAVDGMRDLGVPPGAIDSRARAISDAGHVVVSAAYIDPATGDWHEQAWLWVEGQWIDLHQPDRAWTAAIGINESLTLAGATLSTSGFGSGAARWQVTLTPVVTAPTFTFTGFFPPVDNPPAVNRTRAGSAIPVKFSLGGDQGLDIFAPGYPSSQPIACDAAADLAPVEQTVTAGGSSLSYDAATGQYSYVWKTDKGWVGSCRRLVLRLTDGTQRHADFSFTR